MEDTDRRDTTPGTDAEQVQRLFLAAIDLDDHDRAAFLRAQRAGPHVIAKVEQLLRAERHVPDWLEATQPGQSSPVLGQAISRYRVVSLLGRGGMGDVYEAEDTVLGRHVALKLLPAHLVHDRDRLARFVQEARTASGLNHPHVVTVYEVGEAQLATPEPSGTTRVHFIAMELVRGRTLRVQLAAGRWPLKRTLEFFVQVADALAAAHAAGIVHRDLKPDNLMVAEGGYAKVLDFGVAKLVGDDGTRSAVATQPGVVVGTIAYMAPEQARGRPVDHRADIFALGCVLYEAVSGQRPFDGRSTAETLHRIADEEIEPPQEPLDRTPREFQRIVRKCLAKDPEQRYQSAKEVAIDLGYLRRSLETGTGGLSDVEVKPTPASIGIPALAAPTPSPGSQVQSSAGHRSARPGRTVSMGVAIVLAAGAAAAGALSVMSMWDGAREVAAGVSRLTVALPSNARVARLEDPALAISHDGALLAYVGTLGSGRALYLRRVNRLDVSPLAGTEGADRPFFSPDDQWIGFFAEGKLKKVAVATGTVVVLSDAPSGRGGAWSADDTIYFSPLQMSGLWKVSGSGGEPTEVTKLDRATGEVSHRWPQLIGDGKALLFTVWMGPGRDERHVVAQALATGERRVLVRGADTGRYVPTGHLVYARADTLMAVPMDVSALQVEGVPVSLADHVRVGAEGAHLAFSDSGTLVVLPGSPGRTSLRLVWVDRTGRTETVPSPPRWYHDISMSPDGRRAAISIGDSSLDVWIYDFARTSLTRLTSGGSSQGPRWTADGTRVVYRGTRRGDRNLYWTLADTAQPEERLTEKPLVSQTPGSWTSDGRRLLFTETSPTTGNDIWMLDATTGEVKVLLATPQSEGQARISPDGRWFAYVCTEAGRNEICVQPFPDANRKWRVSTEGGTEPVWSPTGRELFYVSGTQLMAVEVATRPTFSAGPPRLLFDGPYSHSPGATGAGYDVSRDGQRFLRIQPTEPDPPIDQIHVVTNWFQELKTLVPAR